MTIDEIKLALVELHDFCNYRARCVKCPFACPSNHSTMLYECRLNGEPYEWTVDDWMEKEEVEDHD